MHVNAVECTSGIRHLVAGRTVVMTMVLIIFWQCLETICCIACSLWMTTAVGTGATNDCSSCTAAWPPTEAAGGASLSPCAAARGVPVTYSTAASPDYNILQRVRRVVLLIGVFPELRVLIGVFPELRSSMRRVVLLSGVFADLRSSIISYTALNCPAAICCPLLLSTTLAHDCTN